MKFEINKEEFLIDFLRATLAILATCEFKHNFKMRKRGMCWFNKGLIEINPKVHENFGDLMDTVIHEILHKMKGPGYSEKEICFLANTIQYLLYGGPAK